MLKWHLNGIKQHLNDALITLKRHCKDIVPMIQWHHWIGLGKIPEIKKNSPQTNIQQRGYQLFEFKNKYPNQIPLIVVSVSLEC